MALTLMPDQPEMYAIPIQAQVSYFEEDKTAWVKCSGTLWRTRLYLNCEARALYEGQTVTVLGRLGNSLLITP